MEYMKFEIYIIYLKNFQKYSLKFTSYAFFND